ncbi:MAG TPA: hypothetical protein PLB21_01430 [Actinomycetota bacterium]|nr:hypothetical protein [Actinomycetota bacterium]
MGLGQAIGGDILVLGSTLVGVLLHLGEEVLAACGVGAWTRVSLLFARANSRTGLA